MEKSLRGTRRTQDGLSRGFGLLALTGCVALAGALAPYSALAADAGAPQAREKDLSADSAPGTKTTMPARDATPTTPTRSTRIVTAKSVSDQQQQEAGVDTNSIWSYFSAGFLFDGFIGKERNIESAEVRNGVTRVLSRQTFMAGVGVQAMYPFNVATYVRVSDDGAPAKKYSQHGVGPYIGASLSSDTITDTIGVGVAYSYLRKDGGVRIGIGPVIKLKAQRLAPDFPEDQAAPTATSSMTGSDGMTVSGSAPVTEVKYVQQPALGLQLMVTFTPGFGS